MKLKTMALRNTKLITRKCSTFIIIHRNFCEALFEVQAEYKYDTFRHAISCADGIDVIQKKMGTIKHINASKNKTVHSSIYSAAIKRAQELNEYSECWRLYNEAKHESCIDIYLLTQMINITSSFVETQFLFDYDHKNSKMYNKSKAEVAKHKMLSRVHQLYNEMRYEFKLQATNATYSSLINSCSKFKSFIGAQRYWKLYCEDKHLERHIDVYSAIIYSHVNKTDMIGAMKLFNEMINIYNLQPNGKIISKLLSGFAHLIMMRKKNISKFMEISQLVSEAEQLIKTYLQNIHANIEVFNAICNVYACAGDVVSCFDILHCLLDKKLPANYNIVVAAPLPSPNIYTFNTCLKSLIYCEELYENENTKHNNLNVWRLVDFIFSAMNEYGIERDCVTYSTLFHLCGNSMDDDIKPDLDKAISFYLQLSNSQTVISKKCMYSLLITALQFYDYEGNAELQPIAKQSKYEFIEWWLSEAKDYRVQCSLSIHQLLDIKAKKFRIPK